MTMDIKVISAAAAVIFSAISASVPVAGADRAIVSDADKGFIAPDLKPVPEAWKWISDDEVIFTFNGTYTDSSAFVFNASSRKRITGVMAPEKYGSFPVRPEGAVNLTYSPDSTMLAFTRDNDLYVVEIASGREHRLTFDGTDLILNGYASWVYYYNIRQLTLYDFENDVDIVYEMLNK